MATENEARRLQDTQGFCPGYDIDPLEQARNRFLRLDTTFLLGDTSLRRRFHSMQSGLKKSCFNSNLSRNRKGSLKNNLANSPEHSVEGV